MLRYAKRVNPSMSIMTSTNGIPLARGVLARSIVEQDLLT
jgi:hypothetical protein